MVAYMTFGRGMMLVLVLCVSLLGFVRGFEPLVQTSVGWIQGLRATDGDYNMFLGIPYATINPENPFGLSEPEPPFSEVFQAFDDNTVCPQFEEFNNTIVGEPDCLHLNVFVPHSASQVSRNRLPVLVWIHQGGFRYGFSRKFLYGPKYIVRHDVILVAFNYRLGPYGFMCLDIPEVPGNQGLKDQQIALKWIKDNIHAFGGDPDRITLFGQSAGSMSIDLHLLSDQEKLYRNVIMQSVSSLYFPEFSDPDPAAPMKISEALGYVTTNVYDALNFLSSVEAGEVIEAVSRIGMVTGICVENKFEGVTNFLTEQPLNQDVPKVNGMNVMMGYANQELLFSLINLPPEIFEFINPFQSTIEEGFDLDDIQREKAIRAVRQFYIGDEKISQDVKWELINFFSDTAFVYPIERSIKKFLANGANNIFYFVFSYNGERNFMKNKLNITLGGAAHADELGYLFDISYMPTPNPQDQLVIDRMTTLWTNFAKYDNPTPEATTILPSRWEPITNGSKYSYLDIDSSLNVWRRPFHDRMAFWDLFLAAYGKYEKGYRERSAN